MANAVISGLSMAMLWTLVIIPVAYEVLEGYKSAGKGRKGIGRKGTHRF
jgi:hypothetical protein